MDRHRHAGLQQYVQGATSGARELLPLDRSTDTGMPVTSSRATNPGTDTKVRRGQEKKRPKRPVRKLVPLMRSRFPRPLTAPSGKTNVRLPVRAGNAVIHEFCRVPPPRVHEFSTPVDGLWIRGSR